MSAQLYELLFDAAIKGNYKRLQYILEEGDNSIDVNMHDTSDEDRTMLHEACRCSKKGGSYLPLVELLLLYGADVNSRDRDGATPLHMACESGKNIEIIKLLLDNNSDINSRDNRRPTICFPGMTIPPGGRTPLSIACENSHVDVVRLLLQNNPDVNSISDYGRTSLWYACLGGVPCIGNVNIVQLLINASANVNIQDDSGYTPLHVASSLEHTQTVQLLLQNGANTSIKTRCGETAETLALRESQYNRDTIYLFINFRQEIRKKAFVWLKRRRSR